MFLGRFGWSSKLELHDRYIKNLINLGNFDDKDNRPYYRYIRV